MNQTKEPLEIIISEDQKDFFTMTNTEGTFVYDGEAIILNPYQKTIEGETVDDIYKRNHQCEHLFNLTEKEIVRYSEQIRNLILFHWMFKRNSTTAKDSCFSLKCGNDFIFVVPKCDAEQIRTLYASWSSLTDKPQPSVNLNHIVTLSRKDFESGGQYDFVKPKDIDDFINNLGFPVVYKNGSESNA